MRTAFLFQGMTILRTGIGYPLFKDNAHAIKKLDKASDIVGFSLPDLMWNPAREPDLQHFEKAQLVTLSLSAITTQLLEEKTGYKLWELGEAIAGHSFGEYSALLAAGCCTPEAMLSTLSDCFTPLNLKAAMEPAGMVAVTGPRAELVNEICAEINAEFPQFICEIVNHNAPRQVVLSGHQAAMEEVTRRVSLAKSRLSLIPYTTHNIPGLAAHCRWMEPAIEPLERALEGIDFKPPSIKLILNDGIQWTTDPKVIKRGLVNQLTQPVHWLGVLKALHADGFEHIVNVGPTGVLAKLAKHSGIKFRQIDSLHTPDGMQTYMNKVRPRTLAAD